MNTKERLEQIDKRLADLDIKHKDSSLELQSSHQQTPAQIEDEQFSLKNEKAIIYLNNPELRPPQTRTQEYTGEKLQKLMDEQEQEKKRRENTVGWS